MFARRLASLVVSIILAAEAHAAIPQATQPPTTPAAVDASSWSTYGGNLAGQHFSSLTQINPKNVARLTPAWTFHTDTFRKSGLLNHLAAFEANPVLWNRALFLDSPFDEVFALDAATGRKLWSYDPNIDRNKARGIVTSRGVSLWHDASVPASTARPSCADRVYVATLDARLIAVDAATGLPCQGFGDKGTIDLTRDIALKGNDDYEVTSPVTVVGDAVVVGSSIGDNRAVEEEFGIVRAFDSRTGKQLWAWDPIPWARSQHPRTGAGNAWSAISADSALGLVYVPTGSASPDFYGGYRSGDNRDANSVVALDAKTGRRVWGFQVVHHDIWDYDVASEPTLFTYRPAHGDSVPAIAITTKMGMVFVLNRLTGVPLYPVEERPVPQSTVPGEHTSPTQPFSSLPPLNPLTLSADHLSTLTPEDNAFCRTKLAALQNQGIYTPVSTRLTLLYPGSVGGVNWGSPAMDDGSGILYANVNSLAYITQLVPQLSHWDVFYSTFMADWHVFTHWLRRVLHMPKKEAANSTQPRQFRAPDTGGEEMSAQAGTPYRIYRAPFFSPDGKPCTPMPWGMNVAMDLNTGNILWSHTLGTMVAGQHTGSPTLGGPMITGSGLLFSAATIEPLLRAFEAQSGNELWEAHLPSAAQATPMTYELDGRQYVVIAAGGHGSAGIGQSDAVVAFALPETPKP